MSSPRPRSRRGVLYWARQQMRSLDRWSCKAIMVLCFVGIIAHGIVHR